MVKAFRSDQHTNVVDPGVLGDVDLLLDLRGVLQGVQHSWVEVLNQLWVLIDEQGRIGCVKVVDFVVDELLGNVSFICVSPSVLALSLVRWSVWEQNVISADLHVVPVTLHLNISSLVVIVDRWSGLLTGKCWGLGDLESVLSVFEFFGFGHIGDHNWGVCGLLRHLVELG